MHSQNHYIAPVFNSIRMMFTCSPIVKCYAQLQLTLCYTTNKIIRVLFSKVFMKLFVSENEYDIKRITIYGRKLACKFIILT